MTGFEAYCTFIKLWMHFTKRNYNFFAVTKPPSSLEKFAARKDRFFFNKLAKRVRNQDELIDYLVANFVYQEKEKLWIHDVLSEGAQRIYEEYKKRKESLTYNFSQEILSLVPAVEKANLFEIFRPHKGDWPLIISRVITKEVSLETLIICDDLADLFTLWQEKYKLDDFMISDLKSKCKKLKPFMQYNRDLMMKKLKEIKNDH
jgi:hypothetical protein